MQIYATGGTRAFLAENGIEARDVEDLTGFPPLFDGRVKTLHPKVFGAILYDRDDASASKEQVRVYDIHNLRTLVVNLYPFESTVARKARRCRRRSSRSTSAASRCCARRRKISNTSRF